MLELVYQAETIVWEFINKMRTIDNIERKIPGQYWTNLKENLRRQEKSYHQHAKLGANFHLYRCHW